MASKSAFINVFNQKAEEFCRDLVSTFPEVSDFKQLKIALTLLKNLDEKKPREMFNMFVTDELKTYILQRNETFFLNDFKDHMPSSAPVDASEWDRVIDLIRSLWSGLDAANKDVIWKYFQVLIALNDKCTQ